MLGDGTLLLSDETNKHYYDTEPWQQKVAIWRSEDKGLTWDEGTVASDSATDGGGYARTHGLSATMELLPCLSSLRKSRSVLAEKCLPALSPALFSTSSQLTCSVKLIP